MTKKDYNLIDGTPSFILIPDEGKMLVRKSDGFIVYGEIRLGYAPINDEWMFETPDDYEEVDIVEDKSGEESQTDTEAQYKYLVEQYIRERYTISDELAILRQRDTKTEEFAEYYEYCEACKTRAKEDLGL